MSNSAPACSPVIIESIPSAALTSASAGKVWRRFRNNAGVVNSIPSGLVMVYQTFHSTYAWAGGKMQLGTSLPEHLFVTGRLNLSCPLIRMRRTVVEPAGSDIGAIEETVAFLDYFKELPDPRRWQGDLSTRRGAAVMLACGSGRRGELRRHCAVRREEDRVFASVPAVSPWHARARSPRRYFRRPRRRALPTLFR